jgi:hypothetical protein
MRRAVPASLVPLAVVGIALWRPGLLVSGAGSWRALAVGAGVGLAGLLVLAVVWRRSAVAALWSASLVVLALLAAVFAPGLRERTVVEAFPTPVAEVAAAANPAAPVATPSPSLSPSRSRRPAAPRTAAPRTAGPSTAAPRTAAPVVLARGSLHGIGHRASGSVVLYRLDGRLVVRFEGISVQGTPTPVVHLVASGRRSPSGGVRLGPLKGEHGSFGYDVPAGAPVVRVLVWCQRYAVPIASADLAAVR